MRIALLDYVFVGRIIAKIILFPRSPDCSLPDFFFRDAMIISPYSNKQCIQTATMAFIPSDGDLVPKSSVSLNGSHTIKKVTPIFIP